jgi:hypothetical protein
MQLFFKTWGRLFFYVEVVVSLTILFCAIFILEKLRTLLRIPESIGKPIIFILLMALLLASFYVPNAVRRHFLDGEIAELFILDETGTTLLSVRFVRPNYGRIGIINYTHRLKTFELLSGDFLGRLETAKSSHSYEYMLYGPFGTSAWGINATTGLQLLDLSKPSLIASEAEILAKNPQLGKKIRYVFVDNIYDPVKHTIQAIAPDGRYYRIFPDLKTEQIEHYSRPIYATPDYWLFSWVPGRERKTIRHRHASPSSQTKKAEMISPKLIEELNPEALARKKVWVKHRSSSAKDSDLLLSYVDEHGQELMHINLNKQLKEKKEVMAINTFSTKDEVLLFVSQQGLSLSALRTDPNSGKILARIDYFK